MEFIKMQGAGNDFLLFDGVNNKYENLSEMAKKLCDRRFGVGGDGIMVAYPSSMGDIKMVYYNSDGSKGEMCGNGIRCFSKFVYDKRLVEKEELKIETDDGIKIAKLFLENEKVKEIEIFMGNAKLSSKDFGYFQEKDEMFNEEMEVAGKKINFSSVVVGVPHTTIFCKNFEELDVNFFGEKIEKDKRFLRKTNVNFVEIIDKNRIKIKTWERGAGRTLACGTGSCASVFIGNRLGKLSKNVEVETEGGILKIRLEKNGIFMRGEAKVTFKGEVEWK